MAADVHDQTAALGAKPWQHGLTNLKHAGDVELHQPLPLLQAHLREGSGECSTGVIDDYRRGALLLLQPSNSRCNRGRITEISAFSGYRDPEGAAVLSDRFEGIR